MSSNTWFKLMMMLFLLLYSGLSAMVFAQKKKSSENFKKASRKIETGIEKNNQDTLAQGYFDLGETYYQKGDLEKSETFYQKSKSLFEKIADAEGIAKSSRALARVQEDLHKNKEAISNYSQAQENSLKTGDNASTTLNANDIGRLLKPDSMQTQQRFLQDPVLDRKSVV